ncbi:MAG: formylglycine-generating enzyme family protein [Deltaproteobacteria bacterium]|nr:formylglycine-generating enzyme family protein [Deltaproteobacteria bacterium]
MTERFDRISAGALVLIPKAFCLLLVLAGLFLSAPAGAAIKRTQPVDSTTVQNPKPYKGDVSLPMPCDLNMVFRVASIPAVGKLFDFETYFGARTDPATQYMDMRHLVNLASSMSLDNLPAGMKAVAAEFLEGAGQDQIFLIGKYEVSNAQYEAVMNADGKCPSLKDDSSRPRTEISFFEVQDFLYKYMTWLIEIFPEALPTFAGSDEAVGVVRLPSEAEWEYAARGGQMASSDSLRSEEFFSIEPDDGPRDYGWFNVDGYEVPTELRPIGSFKPNPLGLHDTAGNAAEMVGSPFRMTIDNRLHGSAGGVVYKGGSFQRTFEESLPGRRGEMAPYTSEGANKRRDLGFRLVLAAPEAVGQGEGLAALRQEWASAMRSDAQILDPNAVASLPPLQMAESLLASAQNDEQKALFESIQADLMDQSMIAYRQNQNVVKANCRSLMFIVYTIYNTEERRLDSLQDAKNLTDLIAQYEEFLMEADSQQRAAIEQHIEKSKELYAGAMTRAKSFEESLSYELDYYLELLNQHSSFAKETTDQIMRQLLQDIKGDDPYSRAMTKAYNQVSRDLGRFRREQMRAINLENILANAK